MWPARHSMPHAACRMPGWQPHCGTTPCPLALLADALNLSMVAYGLSAVLTDIYWASAFSPWVR